MKALSNIALTLTPESTQVHGYGYDPASRTLAVEYKTNFSDCTYHYLEVPRETADALAAASSKGSYIYKHVRHKFEFERCGKEQKEARGLAAE